MGSRGATSSTKRKLGYVVVNEMIENDIKNLKKQLDDYRDERSKSFHDWYDFRRDEHQDMSDEEFRKEKGKRYDAHRAFQYEHRGMENLSQLSNERLEKQVKKHYEDLQAKVENKIGKIKYITKTGNNGYDYRMENAKGESVSVEVIGAGGYNVQRYHTRWIIKK